MMNRVAVTIIILAALLLLFFGFARAANAYSCDAVVRAYKAYGMAQLVKWANQYRLTPAQRRAAIDCLRERHAQRGARRNGTRR